MRRLLAVRLCLQLILGSLSLSLPSSSSAPMVAPTQNLNVLERFVLKEKDSVQMSVPSSTESAVTVINAIPPDNFGPVVGFLKRFVQIGDAISEVSFYLASNSYHQTKTLKGPPIFKACLDGADCRAKGFSCPTKTSLKTSDQMSADS
jgi:hypothetical protein